MRVQILLCMYIVSDKIIHSARHFFFIFFHVLRIYVKLSKYKKKWGRIRT